MHTTLHWWKMISRRWSSCTRKNSICCYATSKKIVRWRFSNIILSEKGFQMQFEIFYEELYHAQPIVALKSVNWNRQRSFGAQCNFSSLTMKSARHLTEQLELENLSYFSKAKKNSDGWMQRVHTSIIFLLGFKNRGRG